MATRAALIERGASDGQQLQPHTASRLWLNERLERGKREIFSETVRVTPDLAQLIMEEFNKENRPLYPSKLEQLKVDMLEGRFATNGETVIFAKTGELNDGQHRIQGVVESNTVQRMVFLFGVERQSRFTVDTGKSRSAGDHLQLSGWPYSAVLATTARLITAYEKTGEETIGRTGAISAAEIMARIQKDELLQEAATYAGQWAHKFRAFIKAGYVAFCFYEFASKQPKLAKAFMDKLRDGANLDVDDPIYVARQYLLSRPNLKPNNRLEIVIRAWNAWNKNEKVKTFRVQNVIPEIMA